jgi:hypothetical protein
VTARALKRIGVSLCALLLIIVAFVLLRSGDKRSIKRHSRLDSWLGTLFREQDGVVSSLGYLG